MMTHHTRPWRASRSLRIGSRPGLLCPAAALPTSGAKCGIVMRGMPPKRLQKYPLRTIHTLDLRLRASQPPAPHSLTDPLFPQRAVATVAPPTLAPPPLARPSVQPRVAAVSLT